MQKFMISGFSDEIDADLETQLRAVRELGMEYICLRGVNGKNICEYTPAQVKQQIKPLLDKLPAIWNAGTSVSSAFTFHRTPLPSTGASRYSKSCVH